jgi:hypothetical protein
VRGDIRAERFDAAVGEALVTSLSAVTLNVPRIALAINVVFVRGEVVNLVLNVVPSTT